MAWRARLAAVPQAPLLRRVPRGPGSHLPSTKPPTNALGRTSTVTFHLNGEDLTTQVHRIGGWLGWARLDRVPAWQPDAGRRSQPRRAAVVPPLPGACMLYLATCNTLLSRPPGLRPPARPQQENRLTQERIEAELGAGLLGRVAFYGQSDITALLEVGGAGAWALVSGSEAAHTVLVDRPRRTLPPSLPGPPPHPQASDRGFKQELSKLVDTAVWGAAKEESRRQLASRRGEALAAG